MLVLAAVELILALDGHGAAVFDLAAPLCLAGLSNGIDVDCAGCISQVKAAVLRVESGNSTGQAVVGGLVGFVYELLHGERLNAVGITFGARLNYGKHSRGHAGIELYRSGAVGTGILGNSDFNLSRGFGRLAGAGLGHNPVGGIAHKAHPPVAVREDFDCEGRFLFSEGHCVFPLDGNGRILHFLRAGS